MMIQITIDEHGISTTSDSDIKAAGLILTHFQESDRHNIRNTLHHSHEADSDKNCGYTDSERPRFLGDI